MFSTHECAAAVLVFLLALLLFVPMLAGDITGEDGPEFVTAAAVLGIPHPPGYPLYCMIGHAFTRLPLGTLPWRVSLMSAVFAAGAAALVSLLAARLFQNSVTAPAAALVMATKPEFARQAVVPEVYSMNAFFVALALLLLFMWRTSRRDRTLAWFAVVFGLGMTVHNTFALLAPLFAAFVICVDRRAPGGDAARLLPAPRRWAVYAGLSLLSAAVFWAVCLYLPLRSAANPPLDWGNPETLANWWRHLRREQFDFMVTQYPRGFGRLWEQAKVMAGLYMEQRFLFLDLAGLMLMLFAGRKKDALFLAACAFAVVAGFVLWQNFELTRDWINVMKVFPIPAYMISSLFMAAFLAFLWKKNYQLLCFLLIFMPGFIGGVFGAPLENASKTGYPWARRYAMEILDTLPENAVYVSDSDHGSFSLLYLQAVEGKRPDVINARTYGYVSFPDTGELPGPLRGEAGPFPRRGLEPQIFEWYLRHGDRPLYFEKPPAFPPESGIRLASQGLLWRALRPGEAAPPPRPLPEWTGDDGFAGDFTRDLILCDLHLARAREHYQAMRDNGGEPNDARGRLARREADQALAVYGNDAAMANNAGTLCAKYGDYWKAERFFKKALSLNPGLPAPKKNLERLKGLSATAKGESL